MARSIWRQLQSFAKILLRNVDLVNVMRSPDDILSGGLASLPDYQILSQILRRTARVKALIVRSNPVLFCHNYFNTNKACYQELMSSPLGPVGFNQENGENQFDEWEDCQISSLYLPDMNWNKLITTFLKTKFDWLKQRTHRALPSPSEYIRKFLQPKCAVRDRRS